ncbi:MAG: hypothetical protein ACI8X5_001270 [Planctomycetota bacterium]|jgi:hypothetical protein
MYSNSLSDRLGEGSFSTLKSRYVERQEERFVLVRGYIENGALITADDYIYAGAILSTSPFESDLVAAMASGLTAAEMGLDLGFRIAAESTDRFRMLRGEPQRYGTQYYYVEVLKQWRVYPVDPDTTDAERAAMGVESLAIMKDRVALLNEEVR